jgi:hypothetical protein
MRFNADVPVQGAWARLSYLGTFAVVCRIVGAMVCATMVGGFSAEASTRAELPAVSVTRLRPDADASTRNDRARRADGPAPVLRIAAGRPRRVAFLRFAVPVNSAGAVQKATLRLCARAPAHGAVVTLRTVRDAGWNEESLSWRRQPRLGAAVDRASRFGRGAWVSFDATRLVRDARDGRVAMALVVSSRSG